MTTRHSVSDSLASSIAISQTRSESSRNTACSSSTADQSGSSHQRATDAQPRCAERMTFCRRSGSRSRDAAYLEAVSHPKALMRAEEEPWPRESLGPAGHCGHRTPYSPLAPADQCSQWVRLDQCCRLEVSVRPALCFQLGRFFRSVLCCLPCRSCP
jgi:hypothetical protein